MDIPDFSRTPMVRYKPATSGVVLADLISTYVNGGAHKDAFDLFFEVGETEAYVVFANVFCCYDKEGNFTQMETAVLDKNTLELVWNIDNDFQHLGDRLDDFPVWTLPELREIAKSENDSYPGYYWADVSWQDFI